MKKTFLPLSGLFLVINAFTQHVGIGTSVPAVNLHVTAASTPGQLDGNILITNAITGHTIFDGLRIRMNSSVGSIQNSENGDLLFQTNQGTPGIYGDPQIWIKPTGGIGIGTSTPGAKLEVAGQVKITGGSPGLGKVLTSDASGLASWVAPVVGTHNHFGQTWTGNNDQAGLTINNNSNTTQAIGLDATQGGTNNSGIGVRGLSGASNGVGVMGWSYDSNIYPPHVGNSGVVGISSGGNGVFGSSITGYAIYGRKGNGDGYSGTVAYFVNETPANTAPVVKIAAAGAQPALELNNGYIKVTGANKSAFTITGTGTNASGHILTLNYPNQAANDILLVTHNYNPGGVGGTYHNIPVGVYWNGSAWTIYSEDTTTPMLGKAFNVLVVKQ